MTDNTGRPISDLECRNWLPYQKCFWSVYITHTSLVNSDLLLNELWIAVSATRVEESCVNTLGKQFFKQLISVNRLEYKAYEFMNCGPYKTLLNVDYFIFVVVIVGTTSQAAANFFIFSQNKRNTFIF